MLVVRAGRDTGSKAHGDRLWGIHKYLYKLVLCTVLTSRAQLLLLYIFSKAFCVKPGGAFLELRDARATLKLLDDCRRSIVVQSLSICAPSLREHSLCACALHVPTQSSP